MTSVGTPSALVLGPASPAMRRRLGPLAWCALEALCGRAEPSDDALVADMSLVALAAELGVAKNTAHRAIKTLRSAGLVEHGQARGISGRYDATTYRLTIADDVLRRWLPSARVEPRRSSRGRQVAGRRAAPAAPAGGVGEQLVLLPPA